ncbi:cytochrome P450 monooxygenase [Fusarium bulbicola]|nr:cytochrome P450 monooxygenase [Fusarium bulbicola]
MAAAFFLGHLREIAGDVRPSIAIAGLVAVFLALWSTLSTWQQYNRLREFKGPRLAAISKWWLIRKVGGGRAYLDFWEVTKQYGMFAQ